MSVEISRGGLNFYSSLDASGFLAGAARMENSNQRLIEQLQRLVQVSSSSTNTINQNLASQVNSLSSVEKALYGAFAAYNVQGFLGEMVKVRGEFQQITSSFKTMLGSKEKADALMAEAVQLAAKTPFTLQEVAKGSKQLLAYGFAAKDITTTLTQLGNIASGVQAPLGDIVYLYGTLKASGRVTQMDINQFAGRGIPIYESLAKVMETTTDKVRGLVTAGKIGFPQVEEAFQTMTGAGGKFYNLMSEQSKSLTGQISNLQDAWSQMLNQMGAQGEGVLAGSIQAALALVQNYEQVLKVLGVLIATYGAYKVAVIASTLASSGMTAAELLHMGALVVAQKAQALLNATMLANPYVAAATAIGAVIAALVLFGNATSGAKKAQEELNDIQKETAKTVDVEKEKLNQLVLIAKDKALSDERRTQAIKELNKISPTFLGNITKETIGTAEAQRAIDKYIKSLELSTSIKIKQQKIEEVIKAKQDGPAWNDPARIKALAKTTLFGKGTGVGYEVQARVDFNKDKDAELKALQDSLKADIEKQDVANTKEAKAKPTPRNKQYFEDLLKEQQALLEGLDKANGDLEKKGPAIKKKIAEIRKELESYDTKPHNNQQAERQEEGYLKRKTDLLNKVAEAQSIASAAALGQDEKEIAENRAKYQKILNDITAFNEKAKKLGKPQIGADVVKKVQGLSNTEDQSIKYKQETALQAIEFDKQRKLYEDFENYRNTYGEQKARERYGYEVKSNLDAYKELSAQIASLQGKEAKGTVLSGGEKDRLKQLQAEMVTVQAGLDQQYKAAYEAAQTLEDKIAAIQRDRWDKENALRIANNGKISNEQLKNLEQLERQAIASAQHEALTKTEIFRKANEEIFLLTRDQALKQMADLKDLLKSSTLGENARKELEKQLSNIKIMLDIGVADINLRALQKKLNENASLLDVAKNDEDKKKILQNIAEIKAAIRGVNTDQQEDPFVGAFNSVIQGFEQSTGKGFSALSNGLGQGANYLGGLADPIKGSGLGDALEGLSSIIGIASDAAGAVGSLLSGNISGAITGIFKTIGGIFSLGKKIKEMNAKARAENQKFYDEAKRGEADYQALLRKRDLDQVTRGKNSYRAIIAQLELLKKQSPPIQKAYDTIFNGLQDDEFIEGKGYRHATLFRRVKTWDIMASLKGANYDRLEQLYTQGKLKDQTKTDFEALKKLREELEATGLSIEDLDAQLGEMLTGTSISGLADGLSQLFENGKLAAADFGQSFEDIMKNAIMSSFKMKILQDAITPFYTQLSEIMKNGTPTKEQIAALKGQFMAAAEVATQQIKVAEDVTGYDLINKNGDRGGNSLKGGIQQMSEQTAGLIAGQFGGMRLEQSKTNLILAQQAQAQQALTAQILKNFDTQMRIEANTFRTANNTEQLSDIKRSLEDIKKSTANLDNRSSSNSNANRAVGL